MKNFITHPLLLFLVLFLLSLQIFVVHSADEKPFIFRHNPKDPAKVRLVWNPTLDIAEILQVAQREVRYRYQPSTKKPEPIFNPWRILIREQDGHDANRRYAFVKDDPCTELDFRVAWRDKSGKEYKDVIQTLAAPPTPKKLNAHIKLDSLKKDDGKIMAKISWDIDLSKWEDEKVGDITPKLEMPVCETLFQKNVPLPMIEDAGKTIIFDEKYAMANCKFDYRLTFPVFNNDTQCQTYVATNEDETLSLSLDCSKLLGASKCETKEQSCKADCRPEKFITSPNFDLRDNSTQLFVNLTWEFQSKTKAKGYAIQYYHSWFQYNNKPFDFDNATTKTLGADEKFIILPAESVTESAIWVAQVCKLLEKDCTDIEWSTVPEFGVQYYELHDVTPIWLRPTTPTAPTPPPEPTPKMMKDEGSNLEKGQVVSEKRVDNTNSSPCVSFLASLYFVLVAFILVIS